MYKLFLDTEFAGLKKDTELISIGIISEDNDTFYAEFNINEDIQDDWIKENVIKNLIFRDHTTRFVRMQGGLGGMPLQVSMKGSKENVKKELINFIELLGKKLLMRGKKEEMEIWSDCLAYDWVLFCDIFGTAFDIPKQIYYIPFDICTAMTMLHLDPDCDRDAYAVTKLDGEVKKHNSLWDAKVIKCWYERLMEIHYEWGKGE